MMRDKIQTILRKEALVKLWAQILILSVGIGMGIIYHSLTLEILGYTHGGAIGRLLLLAGMCYLGFKIKNGIRPYPERRGG